MTMITIREAIPNDAAEACDVLRRSITELCIQDHKHDRAVIDDWLANKTMSDVKAWITAPKLHVFLASRQERVVVVAAMADNGRILLNYVAPEARFCGVSKLLMARFEEHARSLGLERCTLETTATAHRFYSSIGYVSDPDQANTSVLCKNLADTNRDDNCGPDQDSSGQPLHQSQSDC